MNTTDFYAVLGVSRDADSGEIRQAFKKLALIHHPDKVPAAERAEAEVRFKVLSEAYDVLGNDESRMVYDAELQFSAQDWQEFYADPQDEAFAESFSPFGAAFAASSRTPDVVHETTFSLEDVYTGRLLKLSTQRQVVCRRCAGSGGRARAVKRRCAACSGTGTTRRSQMVAPNLYSTETVLCDVCSGEGRVFSSRDLCRRCTGSKTQPLRSIIEVYVPRGVKNNHRIVLPGQADECVGKTTGDLIILVHVDPDHPRFRRLGLDLYASCPISLREALAGFHRTVATHLDGRRLRVAVESGAVTGPSTVLRLPGEGLVQQQEDGQEVAGDMYVQCAVQFPRTLPPESIEALIAALGEAGTEGEPGDDADADADGSGGGSGAGGDAGEAAIDVAYETLVEDELPEYSADANDEPEIPVVEEPPAASSSQGTACAVM